MDEDIFDSLFHLEDSYYNDGYRLGVEDGSRAGRIEGRVFGLEKGFEKFVDMGQLNGRACVWAARMPQKTANEGNDVEQSSVNHIQDEEVKPRSTPKDLAQLVSLPANVRLGKHISTLYALSEAESLSTENTEDAVSEFDDRFKRAKSKAKIVENIIKERSVDLNAKEAENSKSKTGSQDRGVKITRAATTEKNMEDFGVKRAS
jgi:hypothetical protein